ncbi:MAG: thiol-disulfide oxidoreductase DCC family protein, partial [Sphingomonadales bacterium]
MQENAPILFYDGHCNLCHKVVRFVVKRDKKKIFLLAPLQGETAVQQLSEEVRSVDSVVLLAGNEVYLKSRAAFSVLKLLGLPWSVLNVFSILPMSLTDKIYDAIARRRYRIWGRRDVCELPDVADQSR